MISRNFPKFYHKTTQKKLLSTGLKKFLSCLRFYIHKERAQIKQLQNLFFFYKPRTKVNKKKLSSSACTTNSLRSLFYLLLEAAEIELSIL